jgi:hypothetical protein
VVGVDIGFNDSCKSILCGNPQVIGPKADPIKRSPNIYGHAAHTICGETRRPGDHQFEPLVLFPILLPSADGRVNQRGLNLNEGAVVSKVGAREVVVDCPRGWLNAKLPSAWQDLGVRSPIRLLGHRKLGL